MGDTPKKTPGLKIIYSVQIKFASAFIVLVIALLALLNTYPVMVSVDLAFNSKYTSLYNQAYVMSSSLSPLESLTEDGVTQVMELLDVMPLQRVIITDDVGRVLYDTSDADPAVGRYAFFAEIYAALSGNEVFYSSSSSAAFMSRMALPVRSRGVTIGSVYLYEYDTEQAKLITDIQSMLRSISLFVGLLALVMTFFFTRALTGRITELVRAMRVVRDGGYDYRMKIKGRDELAELGGEFNNLTDRLQKTEDARRRFVSDASHELKTPLAAIRLLSDSITQAENMDAETMREFAGDIGSEAERLQRTTEKLLALTRLDSEEVTEYGEVDMGKVLEDTLHLLTPLAAKREVNLRFILSEGCKVYATEDDLYGVIFNLAENAIKYNVPGGEVLLRLYREDSFTARLDVDDTGIGIPEEDAPHIFSRFYRVDKARSRDAGGSGLGLSIVRDAVAAHGGTVTVEPREPRGTRFTVRFPLIGEDGGADET